jgi:hypothetical protein
LTKKVYSAFLASFLTVFLTVSAFGFLTLIQILCFLPTMTSTVEFWMKTISTERAIEIGLKQIRVQASFFCCFSFFSAFFEFLAVSNFLFLLAVALDD